MLIHKIINIALENLSFIEEDWEKRIIRSNIIKTIDALSILQRKNVTLRIACVSRIIAVMIEIHKILKTGIDEDEKSNIINILQDQNNHSSICNIIKNNAKKIL